VSQAAGKRYFRTNWTLRDDFTLHQVKRLWR
jgi:hypothetical protein